MALAAFEKTWQFDVNRVQAATGAVLTTHRQLLRGIKNRLVAFGTLPWVVRYSCSSTVAGAANDLVDRWAADTDLVWATADTGTARSWIVLRNTDGCELLIECRGTITTGRGARMVFSPAAHFTGGSTTTRPTATDEIVMIDGVSTTNSGWGVGNMGHVSDRAFAYHLWHSTDGLVSMLMICHGGNAVGFWYLGRISQPVAGFTLPVMAAVYSDNATTPVAGPNITHLLEGILSDAACPRAVFRHGGTNGKLYCVCEGFGDGSNNVASCEPTVRNLAVANEIATGTPWQLPQVGVASLTSGVRGVHGRLFDVSWVSEAGKATGDRFSSSGSAPFTHAVFGDLVLPWNDVVVLAA